VLALLSHSIALQRKTQTQAKWMSHWGIDCLVLVLLSHSISLQCKIQKQAKWMSHWEIDQDSVENIAGEQQGVAPRGGHLGSKG
jgi:hypothetical protein